MYTITMSATKVANPNRVARRRITSGVLQKPMKYAGPRIIAATKNRGSQGSICSWVAEKATMAASITGKIAIIPP
jgi:hypothetical protein